MKAWIIRKLNKFFVVYPEKQAYSRPGINNYKIPTIKAL